MCKELFPHLLAPTLMKYNRIKYCSNIALKYQSEKKGFLQKGNTLEGPTITHYCQIRYGLINYYRLKCIRNTRLLQLFLNAALCITLNKLTGDTLSMCMRERQRATAGMWTRLNLILYSLISQVTASLLHVTMAC